MPNKKRFTKGMVDILESLTDIAFIFYLLNIAGDSRTNQTFTFKITARILLYRLHVLAWG